MQQSVQKIEQFYINAWEFLKCYMQLMVTIDYGGEFVVDNQDLLNTSPGDV